MNTYETPTVETATLSADTAVAAFGEIQLPLSEIVPTTK